MATLVQEERSPVLSDKSYRTRSSTLKRSRAVSDDEYPASSMKRKSKEGIECKDGSESKFAASSRASASPSSAKARKRSNQSQRTKASRQTTERIISISIPKSQSEGTEINDLESEDETLIDAKYKR